MNKKISQISAVVATVLTIGVNGLANILPLNNISTGAVSDKFETFFVPAGYVFAIWGVIYVLLLIFAFGFSIVPKKEREYVDEIVPWYILGSIVNIVWIFCWHYGYFLTTQVAIVTLLVTLIAIQLILMQNKPKSLTERVVVHIPFNVYLGWVSVATIANTADVLWFYGFEGFGVHGSYWAALMMLIAGVLAVVMTLKTENKAFSLVIIWAIFGIMVKFPTIVAMTSVGCLTILIIIIALLYKQFGTKLSNKTKKK